MYSHKIQESESIILRFFFSKYNQDEKSDRFQSQVFFDRGSSTWLYI